MVSVCLCYDVVNINLPHNIYQHAAVVLYHPSSSVSLIFIVLYT